MGSMVQAIWPGSRDWGGLLLIDGEIVLERDLKEGEEVPPALRNIPRIPRGTFGMVISGNLPHIVAVTRSKTHVKYVTCVLFPQGIGWFQRMYLKKVM